MPAIRNSATYAWILMVTLFILNVPECAISADMPLNWPWRGITLFYSDASPDDIPLLRKRIRINSVRLDLDVRFVIMQKKLSPAAAWAKALEWADSMLDACRHQGIVGIISISQFPIDPSLSLNQESPGFWQNTGHLADVVRLAGQLSRHFSRRGSEFVAYEILSEPLLREGKRVSNPPEWPVLQDKIVKELRKYDRIRYIVVNPAPGGQPRGYKDIIPLDDSRVIYGAHMYVPHPFTHQGIHGQKIGLTYPGTIGFQSWNLQALKAALSPLKEFQKKHDVLVWIGEFSAVRWAEGAEQYLIDLTNVFHEYSWGYAYFAYKGYHGWNPDFDTSYSSDNREEWTRHYVGLTSIRWQTLQAIYQREQRGFKGF